MPPALDPVEILYALDLGSRGIGRLVVPGAMARAGRPGGHPGPRAWIASLARTGHLVVAGTSNWGAWGVTAHLGLFVDKDL
jgi:hypothetical protein